MANEGNVLQSPNVFEQTAVDAANETPRQPVIKLRKNEEIELRVDTLAFGGQGVARHNGYVVFIDGPCAPGDLVRVRITKAKAGYAESRVQLVLEAASCRAEPRCRHYADGCGGCKAQHISYEEQLAQKHRQVKELFTRIGGFATEVSRIEGCADEGTFHYRNKMEFTVGNRVWIPAGQTLTKAPPGEADDPWSSSNRASALVAGLHVPGRFDKILPIEECHLQIPQGNEMLRLVRDMAIDLGLEPYDIIAHTGFLRNIVIRKGTSPSGALQVMVNLVTAQEEPQRLQPIVEALVARFPEIASVVNNITASKSGVALGEKEILLHGSDTITERLRGLDFNISANSFFQPNPAQADVLYGLIEAACELTGDQVVYDLFCGTGTIGLSLARSSKHVYGFELIESAVADARDNAARNNITTSTFFQGDLAKMLKSPECQDLPPPDVVVTDPPRAGMHPKLVQNIIELAPRRVVYVSCNPSTQVRDVKVLCDNGYTLTAVQPVDMFPHTPHVENICTLIRS